MVVTSRWMASASSTVRVGALPQPPRIPPELMLPGKHGDDILAEAGDLGLDLGLGAVADADHRDDGTDTDDDAQGGAA